MINEYKKSMIETNIQARKEEIAGYEVNIFNYEYMYDKVTEEEYKENLRLGIESNNREKAKVELVLEALEAQLATLQ